MKYFIKLLFLLPIIMPFTAVNADSHEDTMDVLEHDSAVVFHEVSLPEETGNHAEVNHDVELPDHANDDAQDHVNGIHENMRDDDPAEENRKDGERRH